IIKVIINICDIKPAACYLKYVGRIGGIPERTGEDPLKMLETCVEDRNGQYPRSRRVKCERGMDRIRDIIRGLHIRDSGSDIGFCKYIVSRTERSLTEDVEHHDAVVHISVRRRVDECRKTSFQRPRSDDRVMDEASGSAEARRVIQETVARDIVAVRRNGILDPVCRHKRHTAGAVGGLIPRLAWILRGRRSISCTTGNPA